MAQRARLSTGLSGASGEYFVAAELSRRGYIASITPRNANGIDVLAATADGKRTFGIQVKTNQGTEAGWVLSEKAERMEAESLYYVFVRLNGPGGVPDYHVVPSCEVAERCRSSHQAWLAEPGRNGRPHRDNPVRRFFDPKGTFRNRWELLEVDPTAAERIVEADEGAQAPSPAA